MKQERNSQQIDVAIVGYLKNCIKYIGYDVYLSFYVRLNLFVLRRWQ